MIQQFLDCRILKPSFERSSEDVEIDVSRPKDKLEQHQMLV